MGKLIDLTGETFGRLTVLKRGKTQKLKNKTKVFWVCECECGNLTEVLGYHLRNGGIKSCGCIRSEVSSKAAKGRTIDIAGKRFGRLVAIGLVNVRNSKPSWECRCDCGAVVVVRKSNLVTGHTKSCGCYQAELATERLEELKKKVEMRFDEVGNTYGKLTVVERVHGTKGPMWFICKCECGNTHKVAGYRLRNGNTKSCGCYTLSGKDHPRYRHDLTDDERLASRYELHGMHMKKWSRAVMERDGFTCKACGQYSKNLNAHHLDGWNWCREKRFDVENGVTLCEGCHTNFHKVFGYGDNTSEQFNEFRNAIKGGDNV